MHKKLSPGLFDDVSNEKSSSQLPQNHLMNPQSPPSHIEMQKLFEEFNGLKAKMRHYDNQMEVFKNQLSDFVTTFDQRFDRLSQALSRMEKAVHAQGREHEDKMRAVREKIQAKGFEEAKVEGLIERQSVVLRNFENRLAVMQKTLNEKELLLMKYAELLRQNSPKNAAEG